MTLFSGNGIRPVLSDAALLELNRQGFIPGPEEGEAAFIARVEANTRPVSSPLPRVIPPEVAQGALEQVSALYDISPTWVPALFSDAGLLPWHGGGAIFSQEKGGSLLAVLQLRSVFSRKANFLGCYTRNELLAHEYVHIGRMAFDEPSYEEVFAYQTAPQKWRRWLGPLVKRPIEALLFVIVVMGTLGLDIAGTWLASFALLEWALIAKLVPLGLLAVAIVRAARCHRILKRCLAKLEVIIHERRKVWAVAYRLTDLEITTFAKSSPEEIQAYVDEQESRSLRWRQICLAYLSL